MAELAEFLQHALTEGRLLVRSAPHALDTAGADTVLAQAYRSLALTIVDPPPFEIAPALAASQALYAASWYFLVRTAELAPETLRVPAADEPGPHLAVDLAFRFLPVLHRRARAAGPNDPLTIALAELLRQWPLSGVRSDLVEGPTVPPVFAGHPGMQMLYAERLAEHEKPAWFPPAPARNHVELVWHHLGRELPRLPAAVPPLSEDVPA